MSRFILPLALATTALVAGCNMAPKYHRPALAVSATLPQGPAYAKGVDGGVAAADIGWRDFFTDPRLRQVIELGLTNNRDLRVAAANIAQARAEYRVARADLLPTIAASGAAAYQRSARGLSSATTTGSTTGTDTGTTTGTGSAATTSTVTTGRDSHIFSLDLGLSSFELDLFGRVRNLSEAALQQYFATEEAQRTTRISLIAEIASAYATMAADQDQLALSRQTLATYKQTLDLTRAQFEIGVSSELEVRQAQTTYEQARYDIAAATTLIAQDQNALNLLVGTTVTPDLLPNGLGTQSVTLDGLPAGIRSDVLLRRPDVVQAEHLLMAQNANIGAARAAFFPTISLTAALGTLSTGLSGLFAGGSGTWSLTPNATVPLFDYGRNRGNLRYAEASRDSAVATYEKAVQTAFREVADALAQRGTIIEQVNARTDRAEAARVAYTLSDARYRAGVDPFLTTLDSQRTLYSAQQDLVTTRLARVSNLVELYRSLGGGII